MGKDDDSDLRKKFDSWKKSDPCKIDDPCEKKEVTPCKKSPKKVETCKEVEPCKDPCRPPPIKEPPKSAAAKKAAVDDAQERIRKFRESIAKPAIKPPGFMANILKKCQKDILWLIRGLKDPRGLKDQVFQTFGYRRQV